MFEEPSADYTDFFPVSKVIFRLGRGPCPRQPGSLKLRKNIALQNVNQLSVNAVVQRGQGPLHHLKRICGYSYFCGRFAQP
jgi:hypothetical protein